MTFGDYRLDVATRQLFRGTVEVRLSPKGFDLLQFLVDHRARAVSKEELHNYLWPGTFVTEANLASLVAELRRALDDPSAEPKYIRTVRRFGYAFSGQVDATPALPPSALACWIIWAGRELPLGDGGNLIGRDPSADVRLDFPSVSRHHAKVWVTPQGVSVEDLGSKNGTRVNESLVNGRSPLHDFDELTVGSVKMTVRLLRSGESTQTIER